MRMALMLAAVALTAAPAAAQESAVDPELAALARTLSYHLQDGETIAECDVALPT